MAAGKREYLTADEIIGLDDTEIEEVQVDAWGGKWVRVKGLSTQERDQYEASSLKLNAKGEQIGRNLLHVRAKLVALACINEDGSRMFSDAQIPALSNKSAAAVEQVVEVAMRLSGMTKADMEELAENLGALAGDDSSSAQPAMPESQSDSGSAGTPVEKSKS